MTEQDIDKLKRNNQELQEIINNSWDGIGIIDKSTKLLYVNNAFMPILGFAKDELLDSKFLNLIDDRYKAEFTSLLIDNITDKKYKAEINLTCTRKDKKRVYLKITISSMLNKALFVINTKDITSQISDDEILDDYVLSMHTDLHGHITKVSSAFLKLSGYSESDIIGKSFSYISHKDTNPIIYKNMISNLENFQEWNGNLKKVKKDNSIFWLNLRAKPMYNKYGDITGYTLLMFDLTNEINLNDESTTLQNEISKAKDELEQTNILLAQKSKLAIMSETLQMLSHEWRQPLNLISIQAQKLELDYSMENNPTIEETINSLENIKNEAQKLSKTIENFQKFIEPKNEKIATTSSSLIEKVLRNLKNEYDISDINIKKEIKDDFAFKIYLDEISSVLLNVLKNSIEAFKINNILDKKIQITQYFFNDKIFFELSDNARGIKEDIIHKVFEPYFSTKEQKHGVGLGLYMSKVIVNVHLNGIITASNNSLGTTIKISIPLNKNKEN